jgi:hypothetical protein
MRFRKRCGDVACMLHVACCMYVYTHLYIMSYIYVITHLAQAQFGIIPAAAQPWLPRGKGIL